MDPMPGAELTTHLTTGAVIVYLIEWLKRTRLVPFMSQHTVGVNRVLSGVLAAVAAFGITWSYDGAEGVLIVKGLTAPAIGQAAWEWLKQFVWQQLLYDGMIQRRGAGGIPSAARPLAVPPADPPLPHSPLMGGGV